MSCSASRRLCLQVIAHRESTVQRADSVAVIADGRVIEQGQYTELMSKAGSALQALMHSSEGEQSKEG